MKTSAKQHLLNITPYVPGKPIAEVQRELGLKSVIKLASNENPYGPSPKVKMALAKTAARLNRYPESGCFALRQTLSRQLKVKNNQLIFGNGSDELIVFAARAFIKPGDDVVVASPSFMIYEIASKAENAKVKKIPLRDFHYDLPAMRKAVTRKTKIIFIGNPDNPGGTYIPQKMLVKFLKDIPRSVLVFIDEAYYEYVDRPDYPDTVKLLKKHANIFVTRTFSKMYGLAGLRIGYGIGSTELIDILNRVREPFNVNTAAQVAAVACLNDKAYYRRIAREFKRQRAYLYKAVKALGLTYVESFTNFVLIDVQQKSDAIARALLKKGVIVRDMGLWGLDRYIRVTIGSPPENQKFIKALREVL